MKPTWTKVYSGPGYPIDPKKQAERGYFVTSKNEVLLVGVDLAHTPDESMLYFFESVTKGIMAGVDTSAKGADISTLSPIDPEYSCVMVPPEPVDLPKCNCPACVTYDFMQSLDSALLKHQRRYAMVHTEDFQSRLMAIEVKERGI